ncbi:MAG: SGNH/GDSL hydrolase family protein, partial [Acidimicrobiales bacterium]
GLAITGAGVFFTDDIVSLKLVTAVVTVVIAAIGAWFVFRGEALIAVLLLGFLVGWVLVDRTTGEAVDPNPDAEQTILSLGDSYISGEGAPEFFEGTNVVGPNGNQCRRAPTAYPYLAADRLGASLIFLACSGALSTGMDNAGTLPDPLPPVAGGEDQLQRLVAEYGSDVADIDAVLVSVGGNDVGFGTIIKACLLPESCAVPELNEPWLRNVAATRQQLVGVYQTLKTTVGDGTPIVAVLYPRIVRPDERCELAIGDDEIEFVVEFTDALNETVRRAAAEVGINVFEGSVDAFDGRLLCDDDPATNFFHIAPTEGPVADTIVPSNWVHGTLHPRVDGHELIADRLVAVSEDGERQGYLVDLLASVKAGGPANPPPGAGPGPGQPTYEELPDDEWVEEQLYRTVGDLVLPVGLLLIGGLVAAFGLVKARFPLLNFLDPTNNRRPDHIDS